MAWRISYNGFGNGTQASDQWANISIDRLVSTPVFAEDGVSHETTRHEMSGTALISESSNTNLITQIRLADTRLHRQGARLVVETLTSGGSVQTLVDVEATDSEDASDYEDEVNKTPRCEAEFEPIGQIAAVVRFRFIWHDLQLMDGEGNSYTVLSHTWQQQFNTDESGMQTRTVNGMLRARQNVGSGDSPFLGKNPDSYRGLIAPDIPDNFRVTSQQYGTDRSGEKLLYTIEMREYARGLPASARDGDGQFTWRKSISPMGGVSLDALGKKVFDAELTGDTTANPADLLSDLVNASKKRIKWTGDNPDTIETVEVTEFDIFKNMRIGLRIEAYASGNVQNSLDALKDSPFSPEGQPGFFLLQPFVEQGEAIADPPNPYGSALIKATRKAIFQPWSSDNQSAASFNRALTESATSDEQETPVDSWEYTITNEAFNETGEPGGDDPPGGPNPDAANPDESVPTNQNTLHYISVTGIETVEVEHHTGWLKPHSLSNEASDIPFQFRRPTVKIISDYELVRQGRPPRRVFLSAPPGSLVTEESFNVTGGKIDANNRRIFTAKYRRVLELGTFQPIGPSNNPGFFVFNINTPIGTADFTFFAPPLNSLARPFDPRTDNEQYADESTPLIGNGTAFVYEWDESGNTNILTT